MHKKPLKRKALRTDGPTDRRTDIVTYRSRSTRQKLVEHTHESLAVSSWSLQKILKVLRGEVRFVSNLQGVNGN